MHQILSQVGVYSDCGFLFIFDGAIQPAIGIEHVSVFTPQFLVPAMLSLDIPRSEESNNMEYTPIVCRNGHDDARPFRKR